MFTMEPKPRIIADAFIMEQLEDFSGENLQKFTALLKPDADYISLTMESDNSIAIAFIDVVALDQKWNFEDAIEVAKAMESFRIQAIKVMNDMASESENQMCEFAGLSTYLFRPVPREDAPCIPVVDEPTPSHDWVLTDNDCAQYVRFVEDGVYDLIQVIALPEDFQIARGRIYLSDYGEIERRSILAAYSYGEFEDLVDQFGEVKAGQLFAECAFETEFAEFLDENEPDYSTFEFAAGRVREIIGLAISVKDWLLQNPVKTLDMLSMDGHIRITPELGKALLNGKSEWLSADPGCSDCDTKLPANFVLSWLLDYKDMVIQENEPNTTYIMI